MYKLWYWALIEHRAGQPFVAYFPDLQDITASGATEKEAVANLAAAAADHMRQLVESGQSPPRPSLTSEIASDARAKEFGRALIPVEVARAIVRPRT
jgi:predicted RNase H-like HicB family nuclease